MKIAFLNPWENCAENQSYMSLALAGRKIGVDLIGCQVGEHVESSAAEFVISVASAIPKVVDFPTYLTVHEPTRRFLSDKFYLNNLLTYDGFLTISDTLRDFVKDIAFGVGRMEEPGFYYNTPQHSDTYCDVERIARDGALRIAYFGTNWEQAGRLPLQGRLPELFRLLDGRGILRIHGPRATWEAYGLRNYQGPLPFDGLSPQRTYAECGIGLVLLSTDHTKEGIISNRIFEISSVGAVSLCPDIPWIKHWFGDSVLYFPRLASAEVISEKIKEHYQFCVKNPAAAQQMASVAREVFERNFTAERMLENAVRYHYEKVKVGSRRRLGLGADPDITVIIRCGGRPAEMVKRAVDSVRNQTFGKFTIVLSKYAELELAEITRDQSGSVVGFQEILVPRGNRYATLMAGLELIATEYFSILDDDDFWLSDHVETLFTSGRQIDPTFDAVFSGVFAVSDKPTQILEGLAWNRNIYVFGFRERPQSWLDVTREFVPNCFVARTALIPQRLSELRALETAEDSLIIALVTRRKPPIFSFKATAAYTRVDGSGSNFDLHPLRRADLTSVAIRAGLLFAFEWIANAHTASVIDAWRVIDISTASALDELGAPLMAEGCEYWEFAERMSIGPAGTRKSAHKISARKGQVGHVCFGPYVKLPPGDYRVDFMIEPSERTFFRLPKNAHSTAGRIDVVNAEAGWEATAAEFVSSQSCVSLYFAIPNIMKNKSIEFRAFSNGKTNFTIRSIRLYAILIN